MVELREISTNLPFPLLLARLGFGLVEVEDVPVLLSSLSLSPSLS